MLYCIFILFFVFCVHRFPTATIVPMETVRCLAGSVCVMQDVTVNSVSVAAVKTSRYHSETSMRTWHRVERKDTNILTFIYQIL